MSEYKPPLWEQHEYLNLAQISKAEDMRKLMFDCWRKGLKRKDILPLAQEIDHQTTDRDVQIYFRAMFNTELSPNPVFLKTNQSQQTSEPAL